MKISENHNPYSQTLAPKAPSKEAQDSIWTRDIAIGPPWNLKEKQQFFYLLGTLIRSGLGILDAFIVLKDQFRKKKLRSIIDEIQEKLEEGQALSGIMEQSGAYFSVFDVQNIRMGEQTGQLANMLRELGEFYGKRVQLRRKITQALSYPIAVILVASLVLSFMLSFVVPMFQDIFKQFDAELPPITQQILALSNFFQESGGMVFLIVLVVMIGLFLLRKNETYRRITSSLIMRVPFLGSMIFKLHLARMAYSLGLLLTAKVKLDQALSTTAQLVSFYPIQKALLQVKEEVVQGVSFFQALKNRAIFPSYILQMVKVGEKTAKLDELLSQTAQQLEEESQTTIGQLTQFLEPVLIIILGGMVALILVAMYLPMFELSNAVIK